MQFDLFHSVARIDSVLPKVSCRRVFENLIAQVVLGEQLGYKTLWLAESHFSSEVQKCHAKPVIPKFSGEVGLNCDSFQLINLLCERTSYLNFGTAILNIVGNGGPIAAADRVNSLAFLNMLRETPREMHIGFATGRFPYINTPFGITPRNAFEAEQWDACRRHIFLEATEIFLRLLQGEVLSSQDTQPWMDGQYPKRWEFEPLQLVPVMDDHAKSHLHFVLGSHDPLARDLAFGFADVDVFNLSFTPPGQLEKIHAELKEKCATVGRKPWHRSRLPRTVLVFIDKKREKARQMASECFDTYIAAMQGTAVLPPKDHLMARALIGDSAEIIDQLLDSDEKGFHTDDRLMLWFEFNQNDNDAVCSQMRLFAEKVMPAVARNTATSAVS